MCHSELVNLKLYCGTKMEVGVAKPSQRQYLQASEELTALLDFKYILTVDVAST